MSVFALKQPEGECAKLVVGDAKDEASHKERCVIIEHTIVEGSIEASVSQFMIADGCLPIQAIYFVVGLTRQQTNLHRIHRRQVGILCQNGGLTGHYQHQKPPSESIKNDF